ncbi:MAG: hypothetical protein LUF32_05170 [Clostridiales bacterium]|nr:hypothetical protein [Clostridiales bacterium]
MKKVKRIIALVGVIALLALYVYTLVLAIVGSEQTMNMLITAIVATVVLPTLLWTYSFIYKLLKNNYSEEARENLEKMKKAQHLSEENAAKTGQEEHIAGRNPK